eukprot:Nitzschia sp. Nitz4//scaffold242_size29646//19350//22324//NITZ4_008052-RA/size29646-processed-gene-0.13-mRNA-1//1//CDS//3329543818//3608//frame0
MAAVCNQTLNGEDTSSSATDTPHRLPSSCTDRWTHCIHQVHIPMVETLVHLARIAAYHPKRTISLIVPLSLLLVAIGMVTNFNLCVDEEELWSPIGSYPVAHFDWIKGDSGFPPTPRYFTLSVHANGDNVVSLQGMNRLFMAADTVFQDTPGYNDLCLAGTVPLADGTMTCAVSSPTTFWNHSFEIYQEQIQQEYDLNLAFSAYFYPNGAPVDHEGILGDVVFDQDNIVQFAPIYIVHIDLPRQDDETEAEEFEKLALENLGRLRQEWMEDAANPFRLEYFADRSFADEFSRAILKDIPLVPIVFLVMSVFTSMVFFKRDPVQSRTVVGFGAVCSVLLAIMAGYGLMFIAGTPFTSMTQILPFIMFGVGLDGAFILTGAFFRTNHAKTTEDRVEDTVRDVGLSITLTTLTSATAFALGCLSSIPSVRWLCLYAFPTMLVSYVYQFTFFIAIMVLDERRVAKNRRDWLCCLAAKPHPVQSLDPHAMADTDISVGDSVCHGMHHSDDEDSTTSSDAKVEVDLEAHASVVPNARHKHGKGRRITIMPEESKVDRFMVWYAEKLLKNNTARIIVVLSFLGLLIGCAVSASRLKQSFDYREVLPGDSYITPLLDSLEDHSSRGGAIVNIYFRDVDQSSPGIQQQMEAYVNDLVALESIPNQPAFFWLRDFNVYQESLGDTASNRTFHDLFNEFFHHPVYNSIYSEDIVLDEYGDISSSRTTVYINGLDFTVVTTQINALLDQRAVTISQPINEGAKECAFFTFSDTYLIWEFYSIAVEELILTTILSVASVTVLGTLFMPHWSAILFVGPLICILYIDLLGVIQMAGLAVNPVSYVSLVMSIGLLVDFIVHILLRYYEVDGTRFEKTKELLRTMGSSVLLGGLSTFLGVIPLAFSTSSAFFTIFVAFMGLVSVGIAHGLILLPVLLSMFGPESKDVVVISESYR